MSKIYLVIVVTKVATPAGYKPRTTTLKIATVIKKKSSSLIEKIKSEITAEVKRQLEENNGVKIEVKSKVEITPLDGFAANYYKEDKK